MYSYQRKHALKCMCEGLRAAYENYGDYYYYETEVLGEERAPDMKKNVVMELRGAHNRITEFIGKLESFFVP